MPAYDFVIAGGGLAGLSLACHLALSPLGGGSILIVDRQPNRIQNRSWSYWTDQPTIFDSAVCARWSQLQVAGPAFSKRIPLPGWRYELMHGHDLNRFARRLLAGHPVTFQRGTVDQVLDRPQGARVILDGQPIEAKWVFDSTAEPAPDRPGQPHLAMQFRSWMVETRAAAFNPQAATFLDFRTPQHHDTRFFYVLPLSECRALVQYVVLSAAGLHQGEAEAALRGYLASALGIDPYRVLAEEFGALPINDAILPRRLGPHVMAIGLKGGLVKPSTGFGFHRIQLDSAAIVRSLRLTGQPWRVPAVSARHRAYDALLLEVLSRRGDEAQAIFGTLFARNPIRRVLRFLDETSTPAEDLALIATLPARPFLESLPRTMIARAGLPGLRWLT